MTNGENESQGAVVPLLLKEGLARAADERGVDRLAGLFATLKSV